ncbi:hypothetical protein TRIUR3_24459 [Triticum urartu]|uniref:DUF6598 domain-containing protein n=1 Tax=Triticum urartu TaxID=4572 RepID=M7YNA3_TRIUA|nr:hypothetical protein TRIUR3_24459 [Triticum urartu]
MKICYSDDDEEIDLKSPSEIVALHAACRDRITEYDPKKRARVLTRFCGVNLAGFDLDRESKVGLGPLLEDVTPQLWELRAGTSYNVVSVRVIESDRGYPEDMLALTGPRRGLVAFDNIHFEFNLKVKGDPDDEDFSKGVIESRTFDSGPITMMLPSWLSTVELVFAPVKHPVAASLQINILNGPPYAPFVGKVSAGTRNAETHIILYDGRAMSCSGILVGDDGSIPLSRNLVVIPIPTWDDDEEFLVHVCIFDNDEDEGTHVTLQHPDEEHVCTHGSNELKVKVTWTAILTRPMGAKYNPKRNLSWAERYGSLNYSG